MICNKTSYVVECPEATNIKEIYAVAVYTSQNDNKKILVIDRIVSRINFFDGLGERTFMEGKMDWHCDGTALVCCSWKEQSTVSLFVPPYGRGNFVSTEIERGYVR